MELKGGWKFIPYTDHVIRAVAAYHIKWEPSFFLLCITKICIYLTKSRAKNHQCVNNTLLLLHLLLLFLTHHVHSSCSWASLMPCSTINALSLYLPLPSCNLFDVLCEWANNELLLRISKCSLRVLTGWLFNCPLKVCQCQSLYHGLCIDRDTIFKLPWKRSRRMWKVLLLRDRQRLLLISTHGSPKRNFICTRPSSSSLPNQRSDKLLCNLPPVQGDH